ncbi:MAG: glycosyltransferase family 2 protein [Chloroflexia bacterium]
MDDPQPPHEPDVSVVIVNYNGGRYLPSCLKALADVGSRDVEIIVVDNGSTDGSLAVLAEAERKGLRIIRTGQNLGFGRANNLGTSAARGKHYLLLNTDCFLRPGALERLVSVLEKRLDVAIVGPRLLNANGTLQPSCHNFPVPIVLFLEQSLLWKLLGGILLLRGLRGPLLIAGPHDRERAVDWLAGACLLVRAEAYWAARGFDERFFFYWEETDLCLRLKRLGWDVLFEPGAAAVHLGGGSSADPDLLLHFFKSLYIFYRKHYNPGRLITARLIIRLMSLVKAARAGSLWLSKENRRKARRSKQEAASWLRIARL